MVYGSSSSRKRGGVKKVTSINNGHKHFWNKRSKRTSVNDGHSHPINLKLKLAERGKTNHTHRLLDGKK